MDLHNVTKRYEEQRLFWAREIAEVLKKPQHRSLAKILRRLVTVGKPLNGKDMADSLRDSLALKENSKMSWGHYIAQRLNDLKENGFAKEIKGKRAYLYVHTELAELVCGYLPEDEYAVSTHTLNTKEITTRLRQPKHLRKLCLLRQLMLLGQPMNSIGMTEYLHTENSMKKTSKSNTVQHILLFLMDHGLVTRTRDKKGYWYVPTAFAKDILSHLPIDEHVASEQAVPSSNGMSLETDTSAVSVE